MIDIKYIDGGNAVNPQGEGLKYIIHCCNDIGAWGAGFVLAIDKISPYPKINYKIWSNDQWCPDDKCLPFKLGQIQEVKIEDDISVINMIGQRGIGMDMIKIGNKVLTVKPIRYEAIEECLQRVASLAKEHGASVHCPKFGSGLSGGNWEHIEELIKDNVSCYDISVTVYNYP